VEDPHRPPAAAPDGATPEQRRRRERSKAALALVVGLAIIASAAFVLWRDRARVDGARATLRPLAIVPPGPAFVLTVDVGRLRAAKSGQALVGRGLAGIAGDACEQVLFQDVDELVLTVPSGAGFEPSSVDSFALIAAGRFLGASVADCAERGIRARQGEAVRTTIGGFASVRDRRRSGEVAARDGLFVLSHGEYLRALLDGAEGRRAEGTPEERERDRLHAELRRVVGRGAPVVLTLALPNGWLRAALADPAAELSPLATLRSAALRAELGADVELAGLIACDDAARCEGLERFLQGARSDLTALVPPEGARALERITLTRKDARLELAARLAADDVAKLLPAGPR
jgi:hypothetical protein